MSLARTLIADMRGDRALGFLPSQPGRGELMIFGEPVEKMDAWGAAALRTLIEYHGRRLQQRVVLSPCTDPKAWQLVHAFVRENCPAHLVLPNDCPLPQGPVPPEVLLQAQQVETLEAAGAFAEGLFDRAPEGLREPARFAAKYLPELVANGFEHTRIAPVPPVACCYFDRERGVLQLVVVDIGRRRPPLTQDSLAVEVLAVKEHCIPSLVGHAAEGSLEVQCTVVSGTGHLHWENGSWRRATVDAVPGFCVAISVAV